MSKETKDKKESLDQNTFVDEGHLDEVDIISDDVIDAPDVIDAVSIEDIPIEDFLKDPAKMAKLTEDADVEESTNWCPQCSDFTIFVDKVCTVCGFAKGNKKSLEKDIEEEGSNNSFEIIPNDELVDGLGFSYSDENEDDY